MSMIIHMLYVAAMWLIGQISQAYGWLGVGIGFEEFAAAIGIIFELLVFIVATLNRKRLHLAIGFSVIVSLAATFGTWLLLFHAQRNKRTPVTYPSINSWDLIFSLVGVIIFWSITFHLLAYEFGENISGITVGKRNLGKDWVKGIDYVYLLISTCSIFRIAVGAANDRDGLDLAESWSAVFLSIAVALRMTRTSIDIFDWAVPGDTDAGDGGADVGSDHGG